MVKLDIVDCSKYTVYEKKNDNFIKILTGLKINEQSFYKWISYNNFEDHPTIIPNGYIERKQTNKKKWLQFVNKHYCGNKQIITIQNKHLIPTISHPNYKYYFTHDNGGRPFIVYISSNDVYIYKQPDNIIFSNELYDLDVDNPKWRYAQLIKHYPIQQYFIGISPKNAMTKHSGGYGRYFNGNSILIQIDTHLYVYIGSEIYSFIAETTIIRYVSPVGNNDVPYPYAIDKNNNYYLLLENIIIKDIPKNIDPYTYYYKKQTISKAYPISKQNNTFKNITGFYILPIDINKEISHFIKNNKQSVGYKQLLPFLIKLDFSEDVIDDIMENYIQNEIEIENENENEKLLEVVRDKYFQDNRYTLNYHILPSHNYKRLQQNIGKYIFIEIDGEKKLLTNQDYTYLLNEYNTNIGIKPISNIKIIQKRL